MCRFFRAGYFIRHTAASCWKPAKYLYTCEMRLIKYALQLVCCYLCRLQLDIARFVYACICIAIDSFVSAHRAMDFLYLVGNGLAFIYLASTSLIRMYWQFVHLNRKHCCFCFLFLSLLLLSTCHSDSSLASRLLRFARCCVQIQCKFMTLPFSPCTL